MSEIGLVELIGKASTLKEALWNLQGTELLIDSKFGGSSYRVIEIRDEFAIIEDVVRPNEQYLHPYGTSVAYSVDRVLAEERAKFILR